MSTSHDGTKNEDECFIAQDQIAAPPPDCHEPPIPMSTGHDETKNEGECFIAQDQEPPIPMNTCHDGIESEGECFVAQNQIAVIPPDGHSTTIPLKMWGVVAQHHIAVIPPNGHDPPIPLEMWGGRDQQLLKTCSKYGVDFIWPKEGETALETKERREEMQRKCKAARQRQKRNEMSPELRDVLRARQAERMRMKRSQMTPEERRESRARQAERMRIKRRNISYQELKKSLSLNGGNYSGDQEGATIEVTVGNTCCSQCGKQTSFERLAVDDSSNVTTRIFNFGLAPAVVAERFAKFCSSYETLAEALLDLLEREKYLVNKYHFIPETDMQSERVIALSTKEDYPDVLQTTIEALKKLTENSKYKSVANTIEELLFSPALPPEYSTHCSIVDEDYEKE